MVNLANGHLSQGEFMVNDCKNYPNCGGFHPNFKTKHYEPVGFCLLNAPDWRWIFLQIGHASPATRGDFGILLKASQGFIDVGLSNFWILQSCPPKFSKRQSKPAPELNGLNVIFHGYVWFTSLAPAAHCLRAATRLATTALMPSVWWWGRGRLPKS